MFSFFGSRDRSNAHFLRLTASYLAETTGYAALCKGACQASLSIEQPEKWSISATYPVVVHFFLCLLLTTFPAKVCHTMQRQIMRQKAKSLNPHPDWF